MTGFIRKVLANFGLVRGVAKSPDPLIERADQTIDAVDKLRVEVVTRRQARLRGLDLQGETRIGTRHRR